MEVFYRHKCIVAVDLRLDGRITGFISFFVLQIGLLYQKTATILFFNYIVLIST